ncbi:MAG: META domain-containing protein [Treponema sp.]|nr:META domain-containing protein [Treponema sp.]
MNRYVKIAALWLIMAAMPFACTSTPKFSDVLDKDWKLIAVQGGSENITFDRGKLVEEDFADIFTLRFDQERVNGTGAPNQYFAPYSLSDKQGISIKAVAQTQMAPLREPEYLKEQDFFAYLQNTGKWNLVKGNLELYSTDKDGAAAVLVFTP